MQRDGYGRRDYSGERREIMNDRDLSALAGVAPTLFRLLRDDAWCLVWRAPTRGGEVDAALTGAGFTNVAEVVWDKGNIGLGYTVRYRHETVAIYAKGAPRPHSAPLSSVLVDWAWSGHARREGGGHPHEKPVSVLRRLIRFASPSAGIVLDPFAGVGSCGVAAIAEGCGYIGVECDPQWWTAAECRLADARHIPHPDLSQSSLFSPPEAA